MPINYIVVEYAHQACSFAFILKEKKFCAAQKYIRWFEEIRYLFMDRFKLGTTAGS